jgi:hypothetical protein
MLHISILSSNFIAEFGCVGNDEMFADVGWYGGHVY